MDDIFYIRRAEPHDVENIIGLIDRTASWLRTKKTDQWATPWPSREGRDQRVRDGVLSGKTFVVCRSKRWPLSRGLMATITLDYEPDRKVWCSDDDSEPALYVHRLVVGRAHAGKGIGSDLLHWAARSAHGAWGATMLRIDVWTTNYALHDYYRGEGFAYIGDSDGAVEDGRKSGALFERGTTVSLAVDTPRLRIIPPKDGTPLLRSVVSGIERPSRKGDAARNAPYAVQRDISPSFAARATGWARREFGRFTARGLTAKGRPGL
ncbi:GNAT family N-acetyltransferase [Nonomuraea sp. NPDC048916]|uniref:GNAT family N-acetyltransferase n=1 Tax=Nonomuraea sp. NPDC048916 TaxID=3154232 RepID=UPI0033DF6645